MGYMIPDAEPDVNQIAADIQCRVQISWITSCVCPRLPMCVESLEHGTSIETHACQSRQKDSRLGEGDDGKMMGGTEEYVVEMMGGTNKI